MSHIKLGAVLVAIAAGTSNAAHISFQSDTDPENPTLVAEFSPARNTGDGSTFITHFEPTFVSLLIDPDNTDPRGAESIEAQLELEMTLDFVHTLETTPGSFSHIFNLVGSFTFSGTEDDRGLIDPNWSLTGTINAGQAVFAGISGASIVNSASMSGSNINYDLSNVPFLGSASALPGQYDFNLSNINDGLGAAIVTGDLLRTGEVPNIGIEPFTADASFSGSFVPTPGTVSIVSISGLCFARRKRSA
jgi:hypothetical protein